METDNLYQTSIKGMTIFKAFLIAFGCIGMVHVIGFFFQTGWLYTLFRALVHGATAVQNRANTYSYYISYTIFILIGLKFNKWKLPYFGSIRFIDFFKLFILAFISYVIIVSLNKIFLTEDTAGVQIKMKIPVFFYNTLALRYLSLYQYVFLYIGILGHGLLKNYGFKKVMVALMVFTIPFMIPSTVFILILYNMLYIYLYYHTRALNVIFFLITFNFIIEISLLLKFGTQKMLFSNVIRDEIIGNHQVYYFLMAIGFVIVLLLLRSFRNPSNVRLWQNDKIESRSSI